MRTQPSPLTSGVDHVGLSVVDLDRSRDFFCNCLGFHVIGERPDYPAVFVSDGTAILTLWQVEAPDRCVAFDRRRNVGLHHLALKAGDPGQLQALHDRVVAWPGATVEPSRCWSSTPPGLAARRWNISSTTVRSTPCST